MRLIAGRRSATSRKIVLLRRAMSIATPSATATSMTTAPGAMNQKSATYGCLTMCLGTGLPIATAIGATSARGAGLGWTTSLGASLPTITAAGAGMAAIGAGARGLSMRLPFTVRHLSDSSVAALDLVLASAGAGAAVMAGSRS